MSVLRFLTDHLQILGLLIWPAVRLFWLRTEVQRLIKAQSVSAAVGAFMWRMVGMVLMMYPVQSAFQVRVMVRLLKEEVSLLIMD